MYNVMNDAWSSYNRHTLRILGETPELEANSLAACRFPITAHDDATSNLGLLVLLIHDGFEAPL